MRDSPVHALFGYGYARVQCGLYVFTHWVMGERGVGMRIVGGSGRPLPTCTARLSTKLSVHTGLSSSVALTPVRHYLIPAKLCVTLPPKIRTRIHPHDNLTLGGKVAILGSPKAVSTSCQKRVYIVLVGLSARPFIVRSKRQVTRVIVTHRRRTT